MHPRLPSANNIQCLSSDNFSQSFQTWFPPCRRSQTPSRAMGTLPYTHCRTRSLFLASLHLTRCNDSRHGEPLRSALFVASPIRREQQPGAAELVQIPKKCQLSCISAQPGTDMHLHRLAQTHPANHVASRHQSGGGAPSPHPRPSHGVRHGLLSLRPVAAPRAGVGSQTARCAAVRSCREPK